MLFLSIGGWIAIIVVVLIIVILLALVANVYNKMVKGRNRCKDAFSQIDVQLTRRFDLIPNLVETVKGYAKHEESILEEFAKARGAYQASNGDIDKVSEANNALTSVLTRFMAVSEQYPELKADAHFTSMMATLKETEDKIAITRQFYNDSALKYKDLVQMFPSNIIAKLFNFKPAPFFEASEADRAVPQVKF